MRSLPGYVKSIKKSILWSVLPCIQVPQILVFEMMNRGLVDIGLFLEPVNTEGLDYIRIQGSDHWIVGIKPDDPLAEKEYITKRI